MGPESLKDRVAIAGIAETPYVRRSRKDLRTLVLEAAEAALADAGMTARDVDGIVTEGMMMPRMFPHDEVAGHLGVARRYSTTISAAGAGIVAAPLLAAMAIESGLASVVLSYFGVDWGSAPGGPYAFHEAYPAKVAFEEPLGYYGQPAYFAAIAHRYMHEYGLTRRQLGAIAVTQRRHAVLNGRAQARTPLTWDDYERSPLVADPLRVADCCLVSDGAGAFVMCSAERAQDCPRPPVYVSGVGYAAAPMGGESIFTQTPDLLVIPGATEAARGALAMSGLALPDVDFAEIYDCFTISLVLAIEDLGFCPKGEGGRFFEAGHHAVGGKLPVNTHGGLLSHGFALGINHVVEAVRQLRHDAGSAQVRGARVGLVGGMCWPEYAVLLLRR